MGPSPQDAAREEMLAIIQRSAGEYQASLDRFFAAGGSRDDALAKIGVSVAAAARFDWSDGYEFEWKMLYLSDVCYASSKTLLGTKDLKVITSKWRCVCVLNFVQISCILQDYYHQRRPSPCSDGRHSLSGSDG